MASRLTDRRKKKIIADYVQTENYTATAKMNGVSPNTVKKLVQGNAETAAMLTQKRDENTKDILDYMDGKRDVVCQIIDKGLTALNDQERLNEASPSQITTAMGTLIDKFTLAEQRKAKTASGPFEIPARLVTSSFVDVHRDILERGHTEYVLDGGRGSTKSSFISLEIPSLVVNNPQLHAVCCRKVGNTMRDSVHAQILWAIDALGLGADFESKVSPLEITYKPTGQKIYFRGADDPIKIKSIRPKFGYIFPM